MKKSLTPGFAVLLACAGSGLGQTAIFIYLPAMIVIQKFFHVTASDMQQTITFYLLGYAVGMLLGGPLQEKLGTKKLFIYGNIIFCLFSLLAAGGFSFSSFLLARIMQGLMVGICTTVTRSSMRSVLEGPHLAKGFSSVSMTFALAAASAPFIGGLLTSFINWRATFILLGIVSLAFAVLSAFFMPLEEKITNKLQFNQIKNGFFEVLKNKLFWRSTLSGTLIYGLSMSFNAIGPFLIMKTLNFSVRDYGYISLIPAAGYLVGAIFTKNYVVKLGQNKVMFIGFLLTILSGTFIAICGVENDLNIYTVILPVFVALAGQAMVFGNSMSIAMKPFSGKSSSYGAASFGFVQQVGLSMVIFFCSYVSTNSLLPLGIIFLSISLVSFVLLKDYVSIRVSPKTLRA